MFECYIWLMVNDGPRNHWEPLDDVEYDDEDPHDFFVRHKRNLEAACAKGGIAFGNLHLTETYGGVAVSAAFALNRQREAPEPERAFLEEIARLAPSTYGMIHMLDTDVLNPKGEFIVLRLANRTITQTVELLVPPSESARAR